MPNRIIRAGINSSDRVNQLDSAEEVFYRRLLNEVDDHGCFDARPAILRASLFSLRVDRVREADISRWIAACVKAGLIVLYEAGGKSFLQVLDTRWQIRSQPKYPLPPTTAARDKSPPSANSGGQMRADDSKCNQLSADVSNCAQLDTLVGDGDGDGVVFEDGGKVETAPLSASEEELQSLATAVQQVTGVKATGWQMEGAIKTAAIELYGQGFSAADLLSVAGRTGKVYKVRHVVEDIVADRQRLGRRSVRSPGQSAPPDDRERRREEARQMALNGSKGSR